MSGIKYTPYGRYNKETQVKINDDKKWAEEAKKFDANKDGYLDFKELKNIDKNKNGRLTRGELTKAAAKQPDSDAATSSKETKSNPYGRYNKDTQVKINDDKKWAEDAKKFDNDKDGYLDFQELRNIDQNDNGRLARRELAKAADQLSLNDALADPKPPSNTIKELEEFINENPDLVDAIFEELYDGLTRKQKRRLRNLFGENPQNNKQEFLLFMATPNKSPALQKAIDAVLSKLPTPDPTLPINNPPSTPPSLPVKPDPTLPINNPPSTPPSLPVKPDPTLPINNPPSTPPSLPVRPDVSEPIYDTPPVDKQKYTTDTYYAKIIAELSPEMIEDLTSGEKGKNRDLQNSINFINDNYEGGLNSFINELLDSDSGASFANFLIYLDTQELTGNNFTEKSQGYNKNKIYTYPEQTAPPAPVAPVTPPTTIAPVLPSAPSNPSSISESGETYIVDVNGYENGTLDIDWSQIPENAQSIVFNLGDADYFGLDVPRQLVFDGFRAGTSARLFTETFNSSELFRDTAMNKLNTETTQGRPGSIPTPSGNNSGLVNRIFVDTFNEADPNENRRGGSATLGGNIFELPLPDQDLDGNLATYNQFTASLYIHEFAHLIEPDVADEDSLQDRRKRDSIFGVDGKENADGSVGVGEICTHCGESHDREMTAFIGATINEMANSGNPLFDGRRYNVNTNDYTNDLSFLDNDFSSQQGKGQDNDYEASNFAPIRDINISGQRLEDIYKDIKQSVFSGDYAAAQELLNLIPKDQEFTHISYDANDLNNNGGDTNSAQAREQNYNIREVIIQELLLRSDSNDWFGTREAETNGTQDQKAFIGNFLNQLVADDASYADNIENARAYLYMDFAQEGINYTPPS